MFWLKKKWINTGFCNLVESQQYYYVIYVSIRNNLHRRQKTNILTVGILQTWDEKTDRIRVFEEVTQKVGSDRRYPETKSFIS